MTLDEMKKWHGEEYPAAVVINGVRVPLSFETPFTRAYYSREPKKEGCEISRFMDGSASITLAELQRGWPIWTEEKRADFCQSCSWLYKQADFPDMLRFIMARGGLPEWSAIAGEVATYLPCEEAYPFLLDPLRTGSVKDCINIVQAIASTKHPEAEETLRKHLRTIWEQPKLWDNDDFLNWEAYAAETCIKHLIELGAPPADFEDQVRKLSEHVCPNNRESCRRFLPKYYPWLPKLEE
ncbi:MAG TPA: hypothetical protein VN281_17885 [Verrucomicrobiae bacterium]|jgi:hypothetical protein|nr:hypothetical protein [Verrucomicrobiae bacterium]